MNNDEYIIKYNDDYVHYEGDYLYISPFKVTLIQNIGGTISATPMTGYKGDTVTLSNSATSPYVFAGYSISGSNLYDTNKFKFNSSDVTGECIFSADFNPLNLNPYTIRVVFSGNFTPVEDYNKPYASYRRVDYNPNTWDITYLRDNWEGLFWNLGIPPDNVLAILGANTSGVVSMRALCMNAPNLSSIALFDTTNVTSMENIFSYDFALSSIPLFNTTNLVNAQGMFTYCYNVQNGALALYNQMSTQTTPPTNHDGTFSECGRNTQTGSAELAQIPQSWGGKKK